MTVVCKNRNNNSNRYDKAYIDTKTYVLSHCYQYMMITDDHDSHFKGIIIPKLAEKDGSHSFRFAIDFGTTNTHIEYSIDGGASRGFDISDSDIQLQKLHITTEYAITQTFDNDFIPEMIGRESPFRYPMRTVLSESANTNWDRPVYTMANINIPFTYGKSKKLPYNEEHTELKWSTLPEDKIRASKYIESLLLMLRTKVLMNNGDLSRTEIVWFYPASMTQSRFNNFKREWQEKFVSLFGAPESNIIAMSESLAPYYHNKRQNGATSTVVSIDIGGGTTDVLIVDRGEPKYLTSFRFAANSIFGDGYSYGASTNGIINKYKDEIQRLLGTNGLDNLNEVFKAELEKERSCDIISFLLSLASNEEIRSKQLNINFAESLSDDNRMKYIVIIFYSAIFYHIANIMKAKKVEMPRHICFSGNGSKVLDILSKDSETLADFTKIIFEQAYNEKYPENGLEIIHPKDAKESTCKGGIKEFTPSSYSSIKEMKTVLLGIDSDTFNEHEQSYEAITDDMLKSVTSCMKSFIDFTFSLDKKFSFHEKFDVDITIMPKVKELCLKDIRNYLDSGINQIKTEIRNDGADDRIGETLFFYPLTGILNALVRNIYKI